MPVNEGIKVTKIKIDKFRRFENIEFEIGKNITLISGQNGTSKSTLLGMLAQPFSFGVIQGEKARKPDNSKYTSNYHGINLAEKIDLAEKPFAYDCEDVFRLSTTHDSIQKNYVYKLYLSGNCIEPDIIKNGLLIRTQARPKKRNEKVARIRFVTSPGSKSSSGAGEGNFPHPVIYFGLNRHWPMALLKKVTVELHQGMDKQDEEWFTEKYKDILLLNQEQHRLEQIKTDFGAKKNLLSAAGCDYDGESLSAGQDNLGQILAAVLSFKRLKKDLGQKYQGGLILIDEIDSTLHAWAQIRLFELLSEVSKEYQLQIVATTHSMFLLKHAFQSSLRKDVKVIYLKREDNGIVDSGFSSFEEIENNLTVQFKPKIPKTVSKISYIFEDNITKEMFFGIIGNSLNKYFKLHTLKSISACTLASIAYLKVPEFKNVLMVVDGDVRSKMPKNIENLIILPGNHRPETLLYLCLRDLKDSDQFWKNSNFTGYSKQAVIGTYQSQLDKADLDSDVDKPKFKAWYDKHRKCWGIKSNIAFQKWAEINKNECKQFCKSFFEILNKILHGRISKAEYDKIFKKYS